MEWPRSARSYWRHALLFLIFEGIVLFLVEPSWLRFLTRSLILPWWFFFVLLNVPLGVSAGIITEIKIEGQRNWIEYIGLWVMAAIVFLTLVVPIHASGPIEEEGDHRWFMFTEEVGDERTLPGDTSGWDLEDAERRLVEDEDEMATRTGAARFFFLPMLVILQALAMLKGAGKSLSVTPALMVTWIAVIMFAMMIPADYDATLYELPYEEEFPTATADLQTQSGATTAWTLISVMTLMIALGMWVAVALDRPTPGDSEDEPEEETYDETRVRVFKP